MRYNKSLWLWIPIFVGCLVGAQPSGAQKLKVGDLAPDFTLQALDGVNLSLSDFKGKVIFIDFFGYNWGLCLAEAVSVEKVWQDFKGESFVTIGVDVWNGTPAQVNANYRAAGRTSFPILLKGSAVGREYGLSFEDYLVIDHEGVIRYRPAAFGVSLKAVRSTIEEALSKLPEPEVAPEAKEAVGEVSWGRIKADME